MRDMNPSLKTYEYVFQHFSDQIMSGALKVNDKVPTERDIAKELGVSRNSVREAYHILEMMGLIECIQGSGNYIRCQPQEYLRKAVRMITVLQDISFSEVLEMRRGYELCALRISMEVITEEELQELHRILTQMDLPMSMRESVALDIAFHRALLGASHNRLVVLSAMLISELLDSFIYNLRTSILADRRRANQLSKAHWDIYHALVNKDLAAGQEAMTRHFDIVAEHLRKIERKIGTSPMSNNEN